MTESNAVPVRFDEVAREAVYRVMELRRDIRDFAPGTIDDETLARLLHAAQLAPSVGFSQPWGFIVVRDVDRRARIRESFLRCRRAEAARFPPERREKYLSYKLEGILDSALNVCVVADLRDRDEAILGTTVQPEAVRASVCCAVQNLWLAARAEGLGVGWVSIVEPAVLRSELALPPGVEPIAYLCLGHPRAFRERPLLEETGWNARRALHSTRHEETWRDGPTADERPHTERRHALHEECRIANPFSASARTGRQGAGERHEAPNQETEKREGHRREAHTRGEDTREEHTREEHTHEEHTREEHGRGEHRRDEHTPDEPTRDRKGRDESDRDEKARGEIGRDESGCGEEVHLGTWSRAPTLSLGQWSAEPYVGAASGRSFCEASRSAAQQHQRQLTKPAGSLGRLEEIAAWYAGAKGRFPPPRPDRALIAVFAGDHGVAVEGVSAFPSSVTAAMVANMMAGGAAITVMAKRMGIDVAIVDVGVAGDLTAVPGNPQVPLIRAKVRAGTANMRREPAMSRQEARAAMEVGASVAARAIRGGHEVLAAGEIGIANTTAAAALVCALTFAAPADIVGAGTGISEETRQHKAEVVADALLLHRDLLRDPLGTLAAVGGLELAAMSGFYLQAARARVPVIVDGFPATAAALIACAIDENVKDHLLASHASAERGAAVATAALGLQPLLDLGLRLGEGTGALLALELLRTAIDLQLGMATFATAGIVGTPSLPSRPQS